jgi:hypothetical protein
MMQVLQYDKINMGAGVAPMMGYINVDLMYEIPLEEKGNMVLLRDDITVMAYFRTLKFETPITEISAYHVIEHLPRPGKSSMSPNVHDVLNLWNLILSMNGKLVLECPDFDQVVREYVEGNMSRKDNIFGLNRRYGDSHLWGYGKKDLADLVKMHGFEVVYQGDGTDYHTSLEPCQRLVGIKRENGNSSG